MTKIRIISAILMVVVLSIIAGKYAVKKDTSIARQLLEALIMASTTVIFLYCIIAKI